MKTGQRAAPFCFEGRQLSPDDDNVNAAAGPKFDEAAPQPKSSRIPVAGRCSLAAAPRHANFSWKSPESITWLRSPDAIGLAAPVLKKYVEKDYICAILAHI